MLRASPFATPSARLRRPSGAPRGPTLQPCAPCALCIPVPRRVCPPQCRMTAPATPRARLRPLAPPPALPPPRWRGGSGSQVIFFEGAVRARALAPAPPTNANDILRTRLPFGHAPPGAPPPGPHGSSRRPLQTRRAGTLPAAETTTQQFVPPNHRRRPLGLQGSITPPLTCTFRPPRALRPRLARPPTVAPLPLQCAKHAV
jgi:hypothetical protein